MYYYRARYYDSKIGKYLNEDPIGFAGGDYNLYRYCYNNSTNIDDPYGLWIPQAIGFGLGAGFAAWQSYNDYNSGKISLGTYMARVGFGGLTGLASTFGVGLWGSVTAGALTSGANTVFTQATDPCSINFNYGQIAGASIFGGLTGGLSFGGEKLGYNFGFTLVGTHRYKCLQE